MLGFKDYTDEENFERAVDALLEGNFSYLNLDDELNELIIESMSQLTYIVEEIYQSYDSEMSETQLTKVSKSKAAEVVNSIHNSYIQDSAVLRKLVSRLIRKHFDDGEIRVILEDSDE